MINRWLLFNIILLVIQITILILSTTSSITFGHGLGDLVYLFWLLLSIITHVVLIIFLSRIKDENRKKFSMRVITFVFLATTSYLMYKASIGRGSEHPWKGELFVEQTVFWNSNPYQQ